MHVGIFCGNLGKDAAVRQLPNGDSVSNFSVGVQVGTREKPETLWVNCALFGKRAESLQKFLVRGTKVTVNGRLTLHTFRDREGKETTALRLNVNELDLHLPPRNEGQRSDTQRSEAPAQQAFDDDIPF